ncbi:MAG: homoserine kinase [Nostocaceae cyanobacterium]|nr:homoserine kinase [Nostocaceae cyanobacterium]
MAAISSVTVTIPATTANLGPGFDCIGAALTLYNEFTFTRLDKGLIITASGAEAERVTTDESNLAYVAFVKLYEYLGETPPPVQIDIKLGVPLARGLGSSATAIVGGLVGGNLLAGSPLGETEVMALAVEMEGHPDNVVPALLGGCRLAATGLGEQKQEWVICEVPWDSGVIPVLAIPDFELSTKEARGVLPSQVSRADAIFNTAHLGLLLRGLETGKGEWLQAALQDRLHQPYRKALIPGYDAVNAAAVAAGAYGMVISGAGPTLLALTDTAHAPDVAVAMQSAWQGQGISAHVQALSIDTQGAKQVGG